MTHVYMWWLATLHAEEEKPVTAPSLPHSVTGRSGLWYIESDRDYQSIAGARDAVPFGGGGTGGGE